MFENDTKKFKSYCVNTLLLWFWSYRREKVRKKGKNHTHVKNVGTSQNFLFPFIDKQFFFVILGHFRPFTPRPLSHPNNPENQNFKKMKISNIEKIKSQKISKCHHFKLVQQKTRSNDVCLLRYGVWQI